MALGEIAGVVQKQVGTQLYYFGTFGSDKVKGCTFVPVVEISKKTYVVEDTTNGYQRPGSASRMRLFMKYLKENPNSVVPPVLLSGRDWRFVPSNGAANFGSIIVESPAAIIDGQHRVGGYVALFEHEEEVRPVDFIVLMGLSVEQEKSEFLTVNTTQRGVPKPLTAYLGESEEANVAWALNQEDDSPFKGRINRTGVMQRNQLFKLHSVAKGIKRTFDNGKFEHLDGEEKVSILRRFWEIIADELEEEWSDIQKLDLEDGRGRNDFQYKLLELTGFMAWSLVAPEILAPSYMEGVGMNWDSVRGLVRACGAIDWRKDGQYQGMTGEYGAGIMKKDMERLLPAVVPIEE